MWMRGCVGWVTLFGGVWVRSPFLAWFGFWIWGLNGHWLVGRVGLAWVGVCGSIRDGFQNFARDYPLEGFRHR